MDDSELLEIAKCIRCKQMFGFHSEKVPRIRMPTGVRLPVCKECVLRYNELRVRCNMPPIEIKPGAYPRKK